MVLRGTVALNKALPFLACCIFFGGHRQTETKAGRSTLTSTLLAAIDLWTNRRRTWDASISCFKQQVFVATARVRWLKLPVACNVTGIKIYKLINSPSSHQAASNDRLWGGCRSEPHPSSRPVPVVSLHCRRVLVLRAGHRATIARQMNSRYFSWWPPYSVRCFLLLLLLLGKTSVNVLSEAFFFDLYFVKGTGRCTDWRKFEWETESGVGKVFPLCSPAPFIWWWSLNRSRKSHSSLLSVRPFYHFCFGPDPRPSAKKRTAIQRQTEQKATDASRTLHRTEILVYGGFPRRPPTLDDVRHTPNNNDNKDVKGSRRADAKRREKNIQFNKRGQRKTDENEIQGKQGPCPDPQLVELAERHGDGNSTPSIVHIYIPHYSALLGRRLTDGENWWTCTLRLLSLFNIFPRSPC